MTRHQPPFPHPSPECSVRRFGVALAVVVLALSFTPWVAVAQDSVSQNPVSQETGSQTTDARDDAPPAASFGEVVDVRVVNVNVWVEGRNGEPAVDLGKDAFELEVDGKKTEISNFRAEVDGSLRESVQAVERPGSDSADDSFVPVEELQTDPGRRTHVVIFVDNTRLRHSNRKQAFNAVREILDEFDPDDLVSVVSLGGSLRFHSEFLFDRDATREALTELEKVAGPPAISEIERRQVFNELSRGQSGGIMARSNLNPGNILMRIRAYAAEEYQRSVVSMKGIDAVVNTLAGAPGRKILLYVGEGIPTYPGAGMYAEYKNSTGRGIGAGNYRVNYISDYMPEVGHYDLEPVMERVADRANSAGVVIYAVDSEASHSGIVRSALTEQGARPQTLSEIDETYRAPLEFTTMATGGKLLRASGRLEEQLTEAVRNFDTFYSLGFIQPEGWEPGSEYQIKVDVKGRGYRVRYQESVRVPMEGEPEARAVVAALMYQAGDNPLEIKVNPGSEVPRDDGTAALPVMVEMPVKNLTLVPREQTHALSLTLYISTKDAAGNPGPVQRIPFHLDIPNDRVEDAMGRSAHYSLPVVLRKGDQHAAVGVRDDLSGAFSVVRIDVAQFTQTL